MKLKLALTLGSLLAALVCLGPPVQANRPSATGFETRCGWFSNPTPGNASLRDREAEWIIGVQGGFQAEGDWPDFKPAQWVKQNRNYGYGCACLQVRVDKQSHEVLEIKSARARPLTQCRKDSALKKWEREL